MKGNMSFVSSSIAVCHPSSLGSASASLPSFSLSIKDASIRKTLEANPRHTLHCLKKKLRSDIDATCFKSCMTPIVFAETYRRLLHNFIVKIVVCVGKKDTNL